MSSVTLIIEKNSWIKEKIERIHTNTINSEIFFANTQDDIRILLRLKDFDLILVGDIISSFAERRELVSTLAQNITQSLVIAYGTDETSANLFRRSLERANITASYMPLEHGKLGAVLNDYKLIKNT